jgi:hypothetical protein
MRAFVNNETFGADYQLTDDFNKPVPDGFTEYPVDEESTATLPRSRWFFNGKAIVGASAITEWFLDPSGSWRAYRPDTSWALFRGTFEELPRPIFDEATGKFKAPNLKEELRAYAGVVRDNKLLNGVLYKETIPVKTDEKGLALIASARQRAESNANADFPFSIGGGKIVRLKSSEIIEVSDMVNDFVADTFEQYESAIKAINNGEYTSKEEVEGHFQ